VQSHAAHDLQLEAIEAREEAAVGHGSDPSGSPSHKVPDITEGTEPLSAEDQTDRVDPTISTGAKDRLILTSKTNWLIAGFLLLYVGAEVSIVSTGTAQLLPNL